MVKLSGMLHRFNPVTVLLIGDFMRDVYTTGKVKRISPEAPVSVLHVQKEESRPGGAGNVALNCVSLGAKVIAVGRIGSDEAGNAIKEALEEEGVDVRLLIAQKGYKTPIKNRLIADAQQVLRVDFEELSPLPERLEEQILMHLPPLLDQANIIALSDYGKGFLSRTLIRAIIEQARAKGVAVIVDPKGEDFSKYQGATMIKPNLQEAYTAAKRTTEAPLDEVASSIFQSCDADMLLVTRSEAGMSLFYKNGQSNHFPVRSKEVNDVTGAGDTVLAMISVALGNHLEVKYGVQLANIAASMAIERLGCARIPFAQIAERLLEYDVENKIFEEEHLFALQQVLEGKRYTVLGIDSTLGMSTALFRHLRTLSPSDSESKLIVYLYDNDPNEEFVSLLSSLAEVDFIVLKCESLKNLCEIIHPTEVYVMEGSALVTLDHATALMSLSRNT